jgi:hypothetical protein
MYTKYENLKSIFKNLTKEEIQSLESLDLHLTEEDLLFPPPEERGFENFLGVYSEEYIRASFEKYGIFSMLEEKGFNNFKLVIDTKNIDRQRLAIYYEETNENNLLCEIILKRKDLKLNFPFTTGLENNSFNFLIVEWLYSQNPQKSFTEDRKPLPGQKHPGLNMARNVLKLLLIMCKKRKIDGILNIPEHYHNAQLYSKYFSYLSPVNEAKRRAIERDLLSKHELSTVSWGIDLNCVYENKEEFRWFVSEQIIPLNKQLINFFNSPTYNNSISENMTKYLYNIDLDKWDNLKKNIQNYICI